MFSTPFLHAGEVCLNSVVLGRCTPLPLQRGRQSQRNLTYIPVVRYIEILKNLAASKPKAANGCGDNREYEVGRRGRSWERIDDRIEEETTSYKFKI